MGFIKITILLQFQRSTKDENQRPGGSKVQCPGAINRNATSVFRDGDFLAVKIMVEDILAGT